MQMRTHVVCGLRVPVQSPTVGLYIEVPRNRPSGWSWVPLDGYNPAAEDMVFAQAELARVMRSYGSTCAGLLHAQGSIGRFRLVARGLYSRRVLGVHEWAWHADVGRYDAVGDPWLLWDMQTSAHDDQDPARPAYSLSGLSRYARGGERENPLTSKRSNTRTEQGSSPRGEDDARPTYRSYHPYAARADRGPVVLDRRAGFLQPDDHNALRERAQRMGLVRIRPGADR